MLKRDDILNENEFENSDIDRTTDKDQINKTNNVRRFTTLKNTSENNNKETFPFTGTLDIIAENGYGFLRGPSFNVTPEDIYVSPYIIKNYELKTCDVIEGLIQMPNEKGKYRTLCEIKKINGRDPSECKKRIGFDNLIPIYPVKLMNLSTTPQQYSMRVLDMFSPIGFGQRGLIVAPPKSGKTMLLKDIANGIAVNHPNVELIVLLIGERPEEVTDMTRFVKGTVIASTFDETEEKQVRMSVFALEKAKRAVETGKDVVILMDSITRLARAYNVVIPSSGKILSGGMDINALHSPKKFFGAGRKIENGGSLTIIATALIETGSKMDEVIFEEFKGTGNMELYLNRTLSNKRIFPAIDVLQSGTRRDDLLIDESLLNRIQILRKFLVEKTPADAMEFLKSKLKLTSNNEEFLMGMNQ